jgi:hypothetical protein
MEYVDVRKVNERRHSGIVLVASYTYSTYSTFKNAAGYPYTEYFINTAEHSRDDRLKYPQMPQKIQRVN